MLNDREAAILHKMIDSSPNPRAHYSFTFPDEDSAALDRLLHIKLISSKGWNPTRYELTDAGRHYFRDADERAAAQRAARRLERREKIMYLVIGAILGGVFTKLFDFLYQFIVP